MQAVRFEMSVPRYLFAAAAGKISRAFCVGGLSCVRFRRDTPEPAPRGENWVLLRPRLSGICGSDLGVIFARDSPALEPFASGPFVFGHENVAEVVETRAGFARGERVVVDPTLGCRPRGFASPCPPCRDGLGGLCLNQTGGALGAGHLGFNKDTGGGWSELFVAHVSMLHRVPDPIADEEAVLVDPFCSSLHPVLEVPPQKEARVLVLGCGVIGLGVIAALRALDHDCAIYAVARHAHQARMAKALGADEVLRAGGEELLERVAELTGARVERPTLGLPVLLGGVDLVYDCVGSARTVEEALRLLAPRGVLVLVGAAAKLKVDWSFVWFKELRVVGTLMSGSHARQGRLAPTYAIALELMRAGRVKLRPLLSKVFPLAEYRAAIDAAASKASSGVIKVALKP